MFVLSRPRLQTLPACASGVDGGFAGLPCYVETYSCSSEVQIIIVCPLFAQVPVSKRNEVLLLEEGGERASPIEG